ncbi:MAG: hypothetical protein R3C56_38440 [Pirellulaceae bacterium]
MWLLQSVVQTFASEKVARDLRLTLVMIKYLRQGYRFIEERDPAKLLTNVTGYRLDQSVRFPSDRVVGDIGRHHCWHCNHFADNPLEAGPHRADDHTVDRRLVLRDSQKARKYFIQGREVIDWLNKVIRENT